MNLRVFVMSLLLTISSSSVFATYEAAHVTSSDYQTDAFEIFVNKKGEIYVNDKKSSVKKLKRMLSKMKQNELSVKLSGDYHASLSIKKRKEIEQLLADYKTKVTLYTDKTFSKVLLF